MIPVLSRDQMRAFDAHAIGVAKVPSVVLMENAGRGAAEVVVRQVLGGNAVGRKVVVVAGAGNNGGDGYVVARHLARVGADVRVLAFGDAAKMTADAKTMREAWLGVGGVVDDAAPAAAVGALAAGADAIVDALFGTGLVREVAGDLADVVRAVNASGRPVVALDLPSGMDADTGKTLGVAIEATLTVTFAHPKLGQLTGRGAVLTGELHVVDIGVPADLVDARSAELLTTEDVRARVAPRSIDAHKYRAGHVAVLAGSPGKVGAALLAAHGTLRAGAGAATIVTWEAAAASLEARTLEVMIARLEAQPPLGAQLDERLQGKRVVVSGPGFGTDARAGEAVAHVLATFTGPVVLDADAITLHAGKPEALRAAKGGVILTPHAGELARLLGTTSEAVEDDRFGRVRDAAAKTGAVVLLKGPYTLVASPDGRVVVNPSGNPVLATAGSGDVLAGIVGALACSLDPFEAAYVGAWLHGAAGDAWRAERGDRGLLAHEIADLVPRVMNELKSA